VVWFLAALTPVQQDAYIERLFNDESWTVPPVVEEADVVALLEAQLRGDEAAINNLIDATNEYDLFAAAVGFLVAAFGEVAPPSAAHGGVAAAVRSARRAPV
jgi:hypothetical protein